jgi:flagellar basal-body rod protein FlgC
MLDGTSGQRGVKIGQITTDPNQGELIYQPQHPHAKADGYVQMPNVNVAMEMVDLLTASRAYEANLAVVRNARQMAAKALTIGR